MLKISDLTFSYAEKPVLDQFNLELSWKKLAALTGPSGCGKTTLLRILAGLEVPQGGTVTGIRGEETSILFQEDRLLPWRTVGEHLLDVLPRGTKLPSPFSFSEGGSESGSIGDWLAFAELEGEEDAYPGELSGGMARRLALARCCVSALARRGKLLLLDEPFTGIDADRRSRILIRLKALPVPALLTTHDRDVAEACDAQILAEGPPLSVQRVRQREKTETEIDL